VDVAIIDSGGANLASLVYALQRLGAKAVVSDDAAVIQAAPRVLLPGVGSAGNAMARLRAKGLHKVIPQLTQPLLGICLGMQLLFDHSDEGDGPADGGAGTQCLGIIAGKVARMTATTQLPVPHMGWNQLAVQQDDPLLTGIGSEAWFYFVHSYCAAPGPSTLAQTVYGAPFTSICSLRNFRGVQFHPERSAGPGARLLANFLTLV
jgi:glutamine amidotransferase